MAGRLKGGGEREKGKRAGGRTALFEFICTVSNSRSTQIHTFSPCFTSLFSQINFTSSRHSVTQASLRLVSLLRGRHIVFQHKLLAAQCLSEAHDACLVNPWLLCKAPSALRFRPFQAFTVNLDKFRQ